VYDTAREMIAGNYDIDLLEMTEAKDLMPKSMRP